MVVNWHLKIRCFLMEHQLKFSLSDVYSIDLFTCWSIYSNLQVNLTVSRMSIINPTSSISLFLCLTFKIQSFDESSKEQTWADGYSEYCGKYLSSDAIEEESSLSSSGKVV